MAVYGGNKDNSLVDLGQIVEETCVEMRKKLAGFDSLVVRGISGLAVGAPVSLNINRPLVVVRKRPQEESSHGWHPVVGLRDIGERWVFLDDFSSTGETEAAAQEAIAERSSARHVATFHYLPIGSIRWLAPLTEVESPSGKSGRRWEDPAFVAFLRDPELVTE